MARELSDDSSRRLQADNDECAQNLLSEYLKGVQLSLSREKGTEPDSIVFVRLDGLDEPSKFEGKGLKDNQTKHAPDDKPADSSAGKKSDDDESNLLSLLAGLGLAAGGTAVLLKWRSLMELLKAPAPPEPASDSKPDAKPERKYLSPLEQKIADLQRKVEKEGWERFDAKPAQLELEKVLTAEALKQAKELGLPPELIASRLDFRNFDLTNVSFNRHSTTIQVHATTPDALDNLRAKIVQFRHAVDATVLFHANPETYNEQLLKASSATTGDGTQFKLSPESRLAMRQALSEYFDKYKNESHDSVKQITSILNQPKYSKLVTELGGDRAAFWDLHGEILRARLSLTNNRRFDSSTLELNPDLKKFVEKEVKSNYFGLWELNNAKIVSHPVMKEMVDGIINGRRQIGEHLTPELISARLHVLKQQANEINAALQQANLTGPALEKARKEQLGPVLKAIKIEELKKQLGEALSEWKAADNANASASASQKAGEIGLKLLRQLDPASYEARVIAKDLVHEGHLHRGHLPSALRPKSDEPERPGQRNFTPVGEADSQEHKINEIARSLGPAMLALAHRRFAMESACEDLLHQITKDGKVRDAKQFRKALDRVIELDPFNKFPLEKAAKNLPAELRAGDTVPPDLSKALATKQAELLKVKSYDFLDPRSRLLAYMMLVNPMHATNIREDLKRAREQMVELSLHGENATPVDNHDSRAAEKSEPKVDLPPSPIEKIDVAPELRSPDMLREFVKRMESRIPELQKRGASDAAIALTEMVRELWSSTTGSANPAFSEDRFEFVFDKSVTEPVFKYVRSTEGEKEEELTVKDRKFFDQSGKEVEPSKVKSIVLLPESLLNGDKAELTRAVYKTSMQQTGKPALNRPDQVGLDKWIESTVGRQVKPPDATASVKTGTDGAGLDTSRPVAPAERVVTMAVTDRGLKISGPEGEREYTFAEAYKEWIDYLSKELSKERSKGTNADKNEIDRLERQITAQKDLYNRLTDSDPARQAKAETRARAAFIGACNSPKLEELAKQHGGGHRGRLVALSQLARFFMFH